MLVDDEEAGDVQLDIAGRTRKVVSLTLKAHKAQPRCTAVAFRPKQNLERMAAFEDVNDLGG